MGKRSKKAQEAYDLALPVAERLGYDLVDAEYAKEGQKMFLTLFIDKRGGITADDCEAFSKEVDPVLDEGMQSDADYFVVSSPGLTRPLETVKDYIRYKDEAIDVKLFAAKDGLKEFTGVISDVTEDSVTFDTEDAQVTVSLKEIAKAVRHIEF